MRVFQRPLHSVFPFGPLQRSLPLRLDGSVPAPPAPLSPPALPTAPLFRLFPQFRSEGDCWWWWLIWWSIFPARSLLYSDLDLDPSWSCWSCFCRYSYWSFLAHVPGNCSSSAVNGPTPSSSYVPHPSTSCSCPLPKLSPSLLSSLCGVRRLLV